MQLASSACPNAATPAAAQRVLAPPAVNGSASLNIPTPGTVRHVALELLVRCLQAACERAPGSVEATCYHAGHRDVVLSELHGHNLGSASWLESCREWQVVLWAQYFLTSTVDADCAHGALPELCGTAGCMLHAVRSLHMRMPPA